MRVAVIGSGISGLSAAWLLENHSRAQCQVTLFEAGSYLGGHTNTVDVTLDGMTHPVDTGFLVCNDWTYPNLLGLFQTLGVETVPSDMSFSATLFDAPGNSRIEWSGSNLATVFAQPANLLRPAFWSMLRDVLRFNRETTQLISTGALERMGQVTLGAFLDQRDFGQAFRNWYLIPMAACIWSAPTQHIHNFPLVTFLTFCHNHGLLSIDERPQWRTVRNGARTYVQKIAAGLADVRLNRPVLRILREGEGVRIFTADGEATFDHVVLACHSDQALALLGDANAAEQQILAQIPYHANRAVLHTDARLLPKRKRAWAAWNYLAPYQGADSQAHVTLTYLLNKLQPLPFSKPVMVTMNPLFEPAPDQVIAEFKYEHPVYLPDSVVAQRDLGLMQGKHRTWFAGAWTRYGFHEDGLLSGMAVARALGASIPWEASIGADFEASAQRGAQ